MALIAVVTAKHSPGASTAALAMTYAWPSPVMLVEADPAGADSHTGLLGGTGSADGGVLGVAMAARSGQGLSTHSLVAQSLALDEQRSHLLLPGLTDPAQAAGVAPWWEHLAPVMRGADEMDVIADCGRLGAAYAPEALWAQADLVVLVLRPLTSPVHLGRLWLRALASRGVDTRVAAHDRLGLLVVEEPSAATMTVGQVVEHTSLPGAPPLTLLGTLPHDPGAAAVLGGRAARSAKFERSQYMRAASQAARNSAATAAANLAVRNTTVRPSLVQRVASGAGYV